MYSLADMRDFLTSPKALSILLAGLVGACGLQPAEGPIVRTKPSYNQPERGIAFQGWAVEQCDLYLRTADFQIYTDGVIERGRIRLKITSQHALTSIPQVTLNFEDVPFWVEGTRDTFVTDLPYNAHMAAQMQNDFAYMILTYQPTFTSEIRQHYVPMAGLPHALAYLGKKCGH